MTDAVAPPPPPAALTWRDTVRALQRPKVLLTLALGFGSGLPFLLTGATFGLWLREYGISLAAIGFLSWVGFAYSFKFLWAPVIDKIDAPLLGRLGRRRGWMVLSQATVGLALVAMAAIGPEGGLGVLAAATLVVAFASATQDIVVDAWRIESADGDEELGLLTSAFQLGYRFAILAANALILFVASAVGWNGAYALYGAAMAIAIAATLAAREPVSRAPIQAGPALWTPRGLFDAIAGPFIAFLKTHKSMALLMLAAISLYRLPDFVMGPMVGPFYVDIGLSKETIGSVRLTFGLAGTLIGIAAAGVCALRLGFGTTLLIGAVVGPGSNIAYTILASQGVSTGLFATVLFVENFSEGFAGAALVAYMSSLTSIGYTATQYALLSSFYALLGKFLKGFSGQAVEALQVGRPLMEAYAIFFLITALVGIPALVLCAYLNYAANKQARALTQPASG
ncbi:MAG: MFS transporter [Hyphomonadaceae bacterium]|nr:MFS transporter [Hyphomonadaceae bacterium]